MMMAVAPTLVLVLPRRGLDLEMVMTTWVKQGHVQNASKGVAEYSRKVVVPPELRDHSEAELLETVEEAQRSSGTLFAQVEEARQLALLAYAVGGLAPTKNRAGRYVVG